MLMTMGVTSSRAASGVAQQVTDDFDRASLITGAIAYVERATNGKVAASGSVVNVSDGRLVFTGVGGDTGRLSLDGVEGFNVSASFVVEFKNQKDEVVYTGDDRDRPRHSIGLILRAAADTSFGHGSEEDPGAGLVSVEFLNNGGLLVRERNIHGKLGFLSSSSSHPITDGPLYDYKAGALGRQYNGRDFDRNNDGVLGEGEPFLLSVDLTGYDLVVSINDKPIYSGRVKTLPVADELTVSLFKGRPGKFSNASTILLDDLNIKVRPGSAQDTPIGKDTGPFLSLTDTQMIWDRGPHQAFTDLIRYKGRLVCAFREADKHDGGIEGAKIVVLTSDDDGKSWELNHEWADPRGDIRDAKLSINPQGELVLLSAIQIFGAKNVDDRKYQSIAIFTDDLETWSEQVDVLDDGYWLWGLHWNPLDGYGYSIGYRADYTAHLYRTTDGRSFQRIADSIDAATHKPNESDIVFDGDYAFCLLRAFGPAYIGTARSPYTEWSWKRLGQPIGGPAMIQMPGGQLLGAGRLYLPDKVKATGVFTVDPHRGTIRERLRLPSGGDTSYPGMVYEDGTLYLSYYSSHEGKSRIYFATINVEAE